MPGKKQTEKAVPSQDKILEIGFEHAIFFDPAQLDFRQDVRDMCTADKCHMYDRCWVCPPACGDVSKSVEKAKKFKKAVMMQTTRQLEESFDIETMLEAAESHKKRFSQAVDLMRGNGYEIGFDLFRTERHMPERLHGVSMKRHAAVSADFGNPGYR